MIERWEIQLSGLVQGIGLRPLLVQISTAQQLTGFVQNTEKGVFLVWEGSVKNLEKGFIDLKKTVGHFNFSKINTSVQSLADFSIKPSLGAASVQDIISVDLATCQLCLQELFDPLNCRIHYPFITCAQCGPRYSITSKLPFDRETTAMAPFQLCPACISEYQDPRNRRFHAQTISCQTCGPRLWLCDTNGKILSEQHQAIKDTIQYLLAGKILATKGIGGFHLMILATHQEAVATLRQRKNRPDKPFALMVKDLNQAQSLCHLSPLEIETLTSRASPIVIAKKKRESTLISENIAPALDHLGIMLAYTPLHHLLLSQLPGPLVATSGNISDEPICYQNEEALSSLQGIADYFMMHNREIIHPLEDSIVKVIANKVRTLRMARGYIPFTLPAKNSDKAYLAMGGYLKNSLALSYQDKIYLSPYIGNLDSTKSVDKFCETFKQFSENAPHATLICDKHPDYSSSQFAKAHMHTPLMVQHHLAHVFAVSAEFGVKEDFIGFAWDGLGYANTECFWGGESFVVDKKKIQHFSTLDPILLLGGEQAINEPRRIALSLLQKHDLPKTITALFTSSELVLLQQMLNQKIRTFPCSSIGRLFDGLSVLLGGPAKISYEAQAAIYLEQLATACPSNQPVIPYQIKVGNQRLLHIIDWQHLLTQILQDLSDNIDSTLIAKKFHLWCRDIICFIANLSQKKQVILSGGVFQNKILTELTIEKLQKQGYNVYCAEIVPTNDGGLALGQIAAIQFQQEANQDVLSYPS